MGYIEVEIQQGCNLFPPYCKARGHVYHYSEILQEKVVGGFANGRHKELEWETGYQATMQVSCMLPMCYATRCLIEHQKLFKLLTDKVTALPDGLARSCSNGSSFACTQGA